MASSPKFKSRARLLQQLGEQLIRNESIALIELVKNSYDADASSVSVKMEEVQDKNHGRIVIQDDGTGMDADVIENVWLQIGSDYKEKEFHGQKTTKVFKRFPIGEKGIGRLGVHKLGNRIEIISKKKGSKEVTLKIDWSKIAEVEYLEDFPIDLKETESGLFSQAKTGTRITITDIKSDWTEAALSDVYRAINSLSSPFESIDSFSVDFSISINGQKPEWIEKLLSWKTVRDHALYDVECEIEGDQIKKFKYKFIPWSTLNKLRPRTITEKDPEIEKVSRMVDERNNPVDLAEHNIGKVVLKLLIFSLDPRVLSYGVQDKKDLKDYLKLNGGIRVFRSGLRVYDYGEPGNDWLDLDIRRVNMPGTKLSNNITIGAVMLPRESSDLVEKTNREGFVENESYKTLVKALGYVIGRIETLRKIDKNLIQKYYGPTPASEPVMSGITDLRVLVEKNVKEEKTKKEINSYLKRIEQDYIEINETLLNSAGAGLTMGIAIHEIEKIIKELKLVVAKEQPSRHLVSLVKSLAELIEGYGLIIGKSRRKDEDLKNILNSATAISKFRFQTHHIDLVDEFSDYRGEAMTKIAKSLIVSSLVNLIDNSIWWLDYGRVKNKKILIRLIGEPKGSITVLIADNGPGFSLPTEEITKPFITGREGGMGLGLHIVKEIMKAHEGSLIFPSTGDFDLPKEFKQGATIALVFKK